MNKFKIEVVLKNGITDITIAPFSYKTVGEFYEHMKELRNTSKYLKFNIDDYVIEYNLDDVSLIKIYIMK